MWHPHCVTDDVRVASFPARIEYERTDTMSGTDDKMRGKFDEATGKAKQAIGDMTDNDKMRDEGRADEAKGKGKQALGNVKNAADDAKDAISDAIDRDKP
jgi:uncharacterized protein YjbJ (UPF0337 family)